MKAEYEPRASKNRTILHEVVPLSTPFVIGFFVGDVCNFKCIYCVHTSPKDSQARLDLHPYFLKLEDFQKYANDIANFPNKVKTILFSSMGEPTLNKDLPKMIEIANKLDLAQTYEVVTNGSILSNELSRELVDSGLSRLCISMQGITNKKYLDICGYDIDIEKFRQNVSYFYNYSRGKCKLHIKTLDICLDNKEDYDSFLSMFSSICDTIYVDNMVKLNNGIDYSQINDNDNKTLFNQSLKRDVKICSPVFYSIYILPNGDTVPCCDPPYPVILGNANRSSLVDIWNSNERKGFLNQQLSLQQYQNSICRDCNNYQAQMFEGDVLDGHEEKIISRLKG